MDRGSIPRTSTMGLGPRFSVCSNPADIPRYVSRLGLPQTPLQNNPDPKNFKIIDFWNVYPHVVIKIKYPDSTNYEGVKILLYKDTTVEAIKRLEVIDPHFCDKHFAPFARFEATKAGIDAAIALAKIL